VTFHVRTGWQGMALDRAIGRRWFDEDGRLHFSIANISKSNVCGYEATEIPDWRSLGLMPGRIYQLLRPPEELAKAASTFDNLPVLSEHVPVDARDHHPELVIGSTGTDARFTAPYLTNSMVIWTAAAIAGIESRKRREISSAYRYRAMMDSGTFGGDRYDGRMVDLIGNHAAIIPEGRVGPDVALDSSLRRRGYSAAEEHSFAARFPHAARIKIAL
jgi:uncharacterized protein